MSFIFPPASAFAQCHASTIVALPDGRLVAAWFAGTAEKDPDTAIWGAIFDGTSWSAPACWFKLGNQAHWNPVLFNAPDGVLHLWFKVGPDCAAWRTWRSQSHDGGRTWSQAVPFIAEDALARGPVRCPPLVSPSGSWLAPASEERLPGPNGPGWWPYIDRSEDGGRTWAMVAVPVPTGTNAIQPTLWSSASGVHCLLRTNRGEIFRSDSTDDGRSWCPTYGIGLPNNNAGIAVAGLPDGRLALLWNPVGKDWGPRTPLRLSLSSDDGRTWATQQDLATGEGEFSYPALTVRDGLITATWTDKRTTIGWWQGRV
jgi:predicted neuraminidase